MKGIFFYDMMPDSMTGETMEKDITECQLMKAGTYRYWDDILEITPDVFREMKRNFDNRVKKVDLAIDYFHSSFAEAAGWIKEVILKENDTELWIKVEWTDSAREKIMAKEIRYLSADFDHDYEDNETGERFGYTLNGGGLTNRPFIKGMEAILHEFSSVDIPKEKREAITRILSNQSPQRKKQMDLSDLKKEIFALSDDQKKEIVKLCGGDAQVSVLSDENASLKKDLDSAKADIVKLSGEVAKQKKDAEFAVLLSDGKAVEAQRVAFMSGDMAEFVKLSVPVNLSEKGTGSPKLDNKSEPSTPAEAQAKLAKLSEDKAKAEKITFADASAIVMGENPKLVELAHKI